MTQERGLLLRPEGVDALRPVPGLRQSRPPIAYVSKQLGHSSIQITVDLYGHFIP
jgi:hypothetical protein